MRKLIGMILFVFPLTACGGERVPAETTDSSTPQVEAPAAETAEGLQIVQVRVEDNAYLFSPESVQAGKPVRLVFDPAGLPGCSKDVTLPDYEIAKFIEAGDATIEFTPETQGPVAVACSMDMYRGTLLVE
jgi:plastocyanin domain-containing protein